MTEEPNKNNVCPFCFQSTLRICDCPIDGPGEGAYCPKCGFTHMDPPPIYTVNRLQKIIDDLGPWASAAMTDPSVCEELKTVFSEVLKEATK